MANWNALAPETVEQIQQLNAQGLGPTAISQQVDLPKSTVKSHVTIPIRTPTGWSGPRIELLKRLWADGQSAGEIAKHKDLRGFSRSAVIGKVFRLGLTRSDELNQQAVTRGQRMRHGDTQRAARPKVARPAVAIVPAAPAPVKEGGPSVNPAAAPLRQIAASWAPANPVPMGDQRRGHCAWPIETGPEFQACNEPVKGRWCAVHATIGTKKDTLGPPRTREPAPMNYGARAPARFGSGRGGGE